MNAYNDLAKLRAAIETFELPSAADWLFDDDGLVHLVDEKRRSIAFMSFSTYERLRTELGNPVTDEELKQRGWRRA